MQLYEINLEKKAYYFNVYFLGETYVTRDNKKGEAYSS